MYRCTAECRDEHCVTPIGCEVAGHCAPAGLNDEQVAAIESALTIPDADR